MVDLYLDTSALVKLYYPEEKSESLAVWIIHTDTPLFYTSLHEIELKNALSLKVFLKEIKARDLKKISKHIKSDLEKGVLMRPSIVWGDVFLKASQLIEQHTARLGTRSLDILHVATALSLQCSRFLSFDKRQIQLAKKSGFKIISLG